MTRRRRITVKQGDCIHHPDHGIGEVQSIRKRSFSGENGTRFAKMYFKRDNVTLLVRESDLEHAIRAPIGATEARKLLSQLECFEGTLSQKWKTRANAHQKMMEAGDPYGYAEVYKGLRERQQDDALSAADRVHLKQSSEFLAEELANALGKTPRETLDQMAEATRSPSA